MVRKEWKAGNIAIVYRTLKSAILISATEWSNGLVV